jgi:hypothetical protein
VRWCCLGPSLAPTIVLHPILPHTTATLSPTIPRQPRSQSESETGHKAAAMERERDVLAAQLAEVPYPIPFTTHTRVHAAAATGVRITSKDLRSVELFSPLLRSNFSLPLLAIHQCHTSATV